MVKRHFPNHKKRSESILAEMENDNVFNHYMDVFEKVATTMFEWKNLPAGCSSRWLERSLYLYGMAAVLYSDKFNSYINTNVAGAGNLNIYGMPVRVNCFAYGFNEMRDVYYPGGVNGREKKDECVLVLNTYRRLPTIVSTYYFGKRLAEAQRVADVNINAQRTPVVIVTDENQRLSMKNAFEQYSGNTPVIYGDQKGFGVENFKALKTEAPFVADKIMDYKRLVWNEWLTFMGISNLKDKRERLIAGETEENNEIINYNLQSFLVPRQEAAELINDKYGLAGSKAVSVRVRADLHNLIKDNESLVSDYTIGGNDE